MNSYKLAFAIVLILSGVKPALAQSQMEYLRSWVGKPPVSVPGEPRRNIYKTPKLQRNLLKLLGGRDYNRLLNNYHVMGPVELVGDYLIVDRCERHNCDESSSFMAVNIATGDVHVAFYKLGKVEWFHTRGKWRDLPQEVLNDEWFKINGPFIKSVTETTRGAT